MNQTTHKNKRVIWESKSRQIGVIAISFVFVAIALWTKERNSPIIFWGAIVFFGGGGLFMLIRLLNPNNQFVAPGSETGKKILEEEFLKSQDDDGLFTYSETGFTAMHEKEIENYLWSDIETIFGFKKDLMTTDEVCMDIFLKDRTIIQLTESTRGWHQFNIHLSAAIPQIPQGWEMNITDPPFATNLTLLFDKNNRSQHEAEKTCYTT